MIFFSHAALNGASDGRSGHLLADHLRSTGQQAAGFLHVVNGEALGRAAGLLHDLGKYSVEFQARLAGNPQPVDHSTAGACVALEKYGNKAGKLLAFCVAGHHAGLPDGCGGSEGRASLEHRIGDEYAIPEIDAVWKQQVPLPEGSEFAVLSLRDTQGEEAFGVQFLIRMLFSALVDADRMDARAWFSGRESGQRAVVPNRLPSMRALRDQLHGYLSELVGGTPDTGINRLRRQVLEQVCSQAELEQGLFSLTVPTGGGKTLTSLAFALDHAVRHGLKRVIYVLPYNSIADHPAQIFRSALQDDGGEIVLEHHGSFDESEVSGCEGHEALRLAMETWDRPIVVTTAIQFYESLFSDRPSRCRKLHKLAESVVILDEAQTLPLSALRPCVGVLRELARNWKTSVVLCGSMQLALEALEPAKGFAGGLKGVRELAPDPLGLRLSAAARRARIVQVEDPMDDATLAARLLAEPQALCIVNTRRHARELYGRIAAAESGGAFHLSGAMCAEHRQKKLGRIRERLENGETVRLVATSLIEAGVDIDFPAVWRAEAGLESIAQAAGRCNREGRGGIGNVHVFRSEEAEGRCPPPETQQCAATARSVMRRHADPLSPQAVEDYFQETYWLAKDRLDRRQIMRRIHKRGSSLDFPFQAIARDFRLIDTALEPIVVLSGTGPSDGWHAKEPTESEQAGALSQRLQPYVVQIPPQARANLLAAGFAGVACEKKFGQQFVVLSNRDLYDAETGLKWDDPSYRAAESLVF